MHEMSIATHLVECILAAAAENDVARIEEVEVEVGAMRLVVPEALEMAFEAARAGTIAAGAALKVVEVAPVARCRPCGRTFHPADGEFLCPDCGQADADIVEGNDIRLTSMVCCTEEEAGERQP